MYGPVCLVLAHMVIGHVRHDRHIVLHMDKFVQRIETFFYWITHKCWCGQKLNKDIQDQEHLKLIYKIFKNSEAHINNTLGRLEEAHPLKF